MKALILQQTNYNLWANTRIADLLVKNPSILDVEVKSSFSSLRKTIHTYHRGQIVAILRELGLTELPATDLIAYLRLLV
jgi:uncharacterized damage-inducible protein DinB